MNQTGQSIHFDFETKIKRMYDHLYANASVRTPAAISAEVGKLIRTASFIEKGAGLFPAFTFSSELKRTIQQGNVDAIQRVAKNVRSNYAEMNKQWKHYNGEGMLLSDADIVWCCLQLDGVIISSGKKDVIGDAVEIFRTSWAKQSSGQFFTDGRVTHLAMTLLQFNPLKGEDIIDICCGTGGFLLAAADHLRAAVESKYEEKDRERITAELGKRLIYGQEVDAEISEVANASLATKLGAPQGKFVTRGDSLSPAAFDPKGGDRLKEGTHLCAASNPPFGTKITVKDPITLQHYELARREGGRVSPRAPDILLLERNVKMLVPGKGRLAIVIPYQILSGPQTRYIRDWILRNTHLEAVVDLPAETFQPHTGTKTALLVVRRRAKILDRLATASDKRVFMSTPRWIGHDRRGKPVYRKSVDGRLTTEVLSDIELVAAAFQEFLNDTEPGAIHEFSFSVPESAVLTDPDLRLNARYHANDTSASRHSGPKDARHLRLGDVCDRIFCPGRFKRNYVEASPQAVPFLGGANITELLVSSKKWIANTDERIDDLVVRAGWILITRSGTTGVVSSVPEAWDGYAISEHVIRIVPNEKKLPATWIHAFLRSNSGQQALAKGVFGSVIDEITPEYVASLEIPVPKKSLVLKRIIDDMGRAEIARQESIARFKAAQEAMASFVEGD